MNIPLLTFTVAVFVTFASMTAPAAETPAKTVRDFGAAGDGKTDDTAAIQQAVDSGLGAVRFPKGNYRLTKTVTIDLDKVGCTGLVGDGTADIVMAGSGPAFHFLGTHEGTADPGSIKPNVWERQRMPLVRGLVISGAHPEADGIEVTGTMQFTVTETDIHDLRHAIHFTKRNRNILVSACHLYHNSGCGIFYDHVNLHQSNIAGCHISYCAGGGVVTRGGEVRNIQIGACDIESNMTPDAPPTANVLLDSTGGSTDEVAITGCTLQHNNKSPGSANIRVIGQGITSTKDQTMTREGHIAIVANAMSDVRVNIDLQHARGVTITGNTFWEGFEDDIRVEDSQVIVIGPNDFDRNPRYVVNGNWSRDLNGLVFRRCADCKLTGFLVKGVWKKKAAVEMDQCDRCTLTDLSVLDSDGASLLMKDCTRCKVSDCILRDDRANESGHSKSLKMEGGKENWVKNNLLPNGVDASPESGVIEGNRP